MLNRYFMGLLLFVCLGCVAVSLYYGLQEPINDDDVHGLNSIWLVAHGKLPYLDFAANHFPGMWLWLSPFAFLAGTGSSFLLAARVFTALLAGLAAYWAARMIRAGPLGVLLLGMGFILVIRKADFFLFRAEYIAVCLLFLHLFLLGRLNETKGRFQSKSFWAAVPLAAAVSMTLRPAVFLAVEPVVILGIVGWRKSLPPLVAWIGGLVLGVSPCLVYLSYHRLWPVAWYWSVKFVTSPVYYQATGGAMKLGISFGWLQVAYLIGGVFLFWGSRWNVRLSKASRLALLASWGSGFVFLLLNPYSMSYAYTHIFLLSVIWLTVSLYGWLDRFRVPLWLRITGVFAMLCVLPATILTGKINPGFDRREQVVQLDVIDWLARVAGDEAVVCIPPYHPIVRFDATYLQDSWQYAKHLAASDVFRESLDDLGEKLLKGSPPVIATDPCKNETGNLDLLSWLRKTNTITGEEATGLRRKLEREYTVVTFPALAISSVSRFGCRFWVRKDRIEAVELPAGAIADDG